MRRALSVVLVLVVLIASARVAFGQEDPCFEKGGLWNSETQSCEFQAGLDINISYPLFITDYDFAEQAVDAWILQRQAEFISFYAAPESLEMMGFGYAWSLNIGYEQYQFSDTIFSLNFVVSDYTGGAHPNSYFKTFTFDTEQQRELSLMDLFQEGVDPLVTIAPIVEADLATQMGEFADSEWIHTGTGDNVANYVNFVLTPASLIFLFPPYQVAAYAAGPQQVEIPLSVLADILAAPFALST